MGSQVGPITVYLILWLLDLSLLSKELVLSVNFNEFLKVYKYSSNSPNV